MKVVAIVGMPGSGKSEVARVFEHHGYKRIRFGDITDEEVDKRGLPLNEENERNVRESLRREHGMAAYAKLSLAKIEVALEKTNVVADGLYSWEEYNLLKTHFHNQFAVLAIWTSPATRYRRLATRQVRPLTKEEAAARDSAEIENLNKGGPIAMADFTICNESDIKELQHNTIKVIACLK